VADGYAVSFMQHTTNAGIPSDKARHACGNTMGARVPVSLNGSSNPDTDYTTKPCGKWLEASIMRRRCSPNSRSCRR
jgi:hypothetical protein